MKHHNTALDLRPDTRRFHAAPAAAGLRLILAALALCCMASAVSAANIKLAWDPPVNNTDGTALTDLAGYKLYRGDAPGRYSIARDMGLATNTTVTNLQAGATYYFAVSAYNATSTESAFSTELSWTAPLTNVLHHFAWSAVAPLQTSGVPFAVSVLAQDSNNVTVAGFAGTVQLSGVGSEAPVIGVGKQTFTFPLRTSSDESRSQIIYLTNEVGQAGWINALALDVSRVSPQGLTNWTIRLKQTAAGYYTNRSPWEATGWTTVYQKSETVSSTGWVEFVFSTPFYYDARSNLVVDFSFRNTNHAAAGYCRYTTAAKYRRLSAAVSRSYGDPLGWLGTSPTPSLNKEIANIRLRIVRPIAIDPDSSSAFAGGTWTGLIAVPGGADNATLMANDGAGHTGLSGAFDVLTGATGSGATDGGTDGPTSWDADGDGVPDSAELAADTDPYDALSFLAMDDLILSADPDFPGVAVQWSSSTNRFYTLQRSTDLRATAGFSDLASHIPGQDPVTVYTDTTATDSGPYYYCVQVEP